MLREIRPAIIVLVLLALITGLAYPLAMTAIAGAIFPKQAEGSLIEKDGKVIGSALIGQEFKDDKYFHGRPSATLAPDPADSTQTVSAPYHAAHSRAPSLPAAPRPPRLHQHRGGALQCRQFRRLQPRPDQQGAERPGQGGRREAE